MTLNRTTQRKALAAAFGAVLAAGLGWALHQFPLGRWLTYRSYNLLHVAGGSRIVPDVVIIFMDEISHQELKQSFTAAWDRALHAKLIDRLTAAGAKAIVFDVVFSDENPAQPAADARLVEAVKANGRVILGAENVRAQKELGDRAKTVVPPFSALVDVAADIGYVEIMPGGDLTIREHTPENPKEDQIPPLSYAAAAFLKVPGIEAPNVRYAHRWVRYYGPPGAVRGVSYRDAVETGRLGDDVFRDRVVFIGARLMTRFAGDRKDEYVNPYTFWAQQGKLTGSVAPFVSGVEIQATMFLNLWRGDWLLRWRPGTELAAILMLGLVAGAGLLPIRPVPAIGVAALASGLVFVASMGLFAWHRTWFPWLIPIVQIAVALAWSSVFNSIQVYVQKRITEKTLALYLSPKLVAKYVSNPGLLKPGAEAQRITIFFSDLEDFTNWSQALTSGELASLMNEYFETAVSRCVHRTDGTLVKYIGDAIFALWNAPDAQGDHAWRACDAALGFRDLPELRANGRVLRTRIGIHTGSAHVGNFGSADRVDYTALGQNVNLASRLEGLNKLLGTRCLISHATQDELGKRLVTRRLGAFQLKGFDTSVEVYELVDRPEQADASRAWLEAFAGALTAFEEFDLEKARAGFERVLELRPGDGPARFFLSRIEESREQPKEKWSVVTVVREK